MSRFFRLEPEVAGGLGPHSVIRRGQHPPKVDHLHYVFDTWLGDELLEAFPCFIVTTQLKHALTERNLTGFEFREVEVSKSDTFSHFNMHLELPEFSWLDVNGIPRDDDFGVEPPGYLIVSARALACLRQGRLDHCRMKSISK